jgi:hypothetical protein
LPPRKLQIFLPGVGVTEKIKFSFVENFGLEEHGKTAKLGSKRAQPRSQIDLPDGISRDEQLGSENLNQPGRNHPFSGSETEE